MAYNLNVIDFSTSSSGDNTAIAAVTGKKILIWALTLENTDSTNDTSIVFKDGTTAYNATAVFIASGGGSYELGTLQGTNYVYEGTNGNAFIINSSAAVALTGRIWYQVL